MRWFILALLLLPTAAAQVPPVSMSWDYLEHGSAQPVLEEVLDVPIEVVVECTFPGGADLMERYTLHFDFNGSLASAAPVESEELPSGLCAFGFPGSWSKVVNLTVAFDQARGDPNGEVIAFLNTTVSMTSSNAQFAPPAQPVTHSAAWFLLGDDEGAVNDAKQPPVPQAQTTPGPAVPLLAGALLLAALRRRA